MSRVAVCVLNGQDCNGVVKFTQENADSPCTINAEVHGLSEGKHGFHIHVYGDTTNGCVSAGGHFNPHGKNHGGPNDEDRHVGDLGNITVGQDGNGVLNVDDSQATLFGENTIVGRSIVVHLGQDDLGQGGFDDSKTTGHAGGRAMCGVIGVTQ
eukprot:TRINITY_DN100833_c0_g1_i1.p1 TRINITY_DN100833_c0_g1~~TRINITY_DN100833_c0_g1_i1.p1  ORF type:complete len:154 (+),score=64.26 TRINITY_DN100833_c0_g1_i1:55-516(+)